MALGVAIVFVALPRRATVPAQAPITEARIHAPAAVEAVPRARWFADAVAAIAVAEPVRVPLAVVPPPQPAPVPVKAAPAVKAEVAKQEPRLVVKRMHNLEQDDLLKQIAKAPRLMLDRTTARAESKQMVRANLVGQAGIDVTPALLDRRPDLAGLPLRRGSACRLTSGAARHLAKGTDGLHNLADKQLAAKLAADIDWSRPERVPALMQVLMVEPPASREILAGHLGGVAGKSASAALAQMALFDPHPDVRRAAIESLVGRPSAEYRSVLLRGFRFPWPVVAEHAAEALVALRCTETVLPLLGVLEGPDPQAPYSKGSGPARYVKEVVRIQHKFNCLLCHPPSFQTTDLVRAPVPPLRENAFMMGGYGGTAPRRNETFVRADVTYLKQDYSVMLQPLTTGEQEQRYDLLVRERFATSADVAAALVRASAGRTDQQQAAAFALRELTGEKPGPRGENWYRFAGEQLQAARPR